MDTIKIIKGVFNNEDIIKDNNAIAAAFADGTFIGIDTKNDDKFQKDFLSGSGNKDEKEIYISTIDMLTPEAEVEVNNGGKRLLVKGVRCKNVSHSDSNRPIPDEAVDRLSKLGSYTDLALQMPDSASWNFDGNGTATTEVTFSAKGKSGSVKSTTKHGKFVVTQPIKIKHYDKADGELPAQSTVYRMGSSSFEGAAIQQDQRFQNGRQISACAEVTPATKKSVTVNDSGILSQSIASNDKWLDISCSAHSCVVVKYGNDTFDTTYSGTVKTRYTTSKDEIESGAPVKIGIYKQNTKVTTEVISNFNAQTGIAADYGNCRFSFETDNPNSTARLTKEGKIPTGGNKEGTLYIYIDGYESIYSKVNEYSYTPDNNLFYAGLYCRNSGWYDAEGYTANKDTTGKIYSVQPTAGSGFKFDSEDMFYVKTATEDSVNANDKLCTVDSTGEVTFKKGTDFEEKESYSKDGDPSFSVSFD